MFPRNNDERATTTLNIHSLSMNLPLLLLLPSNNWKYTQRKEHCRLSHYAAIKILFPALKIGIISALL